jgi:hypothetical protein
LVSKFLSTLLMLKECPSALVSGDSLLVFDLVELRALVAGVSLNIVANHLIVQLLLGFASANMGCELPTISHYAVRQPTEHIVPLARPAQR